MDRAYEGDETRQLALDLDFTPVVPPLRTRVDLWEYDREMYKRRNEVERLFRRLKGFRRIFSRFDKLDAVFLGSILSSSRHCISVNAPQARQVQGTSHPTSCGRLGTTHRHQQKPATIVEPPVRGRRPILAATPRLPDQSTGKSTFPLRVLCL